MLPSEQTHSDDYKVTSPLRIHWVLIQFISVSLCVCLTCDIEPINNRKDERDRVGEEMLVLQSRVAVPHGKCSACGSEYDSEVK